MKIVVFFGAGFSSAWGLPMMRDFFARAKIADYLSEDDKQFLTRLRARAQASHRMLEVRPGNLEDILSLCFASGQFAGNFPEEASDDYKKLCRILQQVYTNVEISRRRYTYYSDLDVTPVEHLLGLHNKIHHDIALITTNYDVVLEFCLWKLHRPCCLPFTWQPSIVKQQDSIGHLYTLNKKELLPVICKLHGSINWFNSADERSELRVESRIVRSHIDDEYLDDKMYDKQDELRFVEQPLVAFKEYMHEDVPIIIPPIVFKVQTHPCFIPIWQAAGQALQEADKLVFVGYSFPDSDNYLRYFIASNLTKPDLDKIQIVAPHATNICKKLAESSNFGSYFKNLLDPVDTQWQSGEYNVVD